MSGSHRVRLAPMLAFTVVSVFVGSNRSSAGILGTWTYRGCIEDYANKTTIAVAAKAATDACSVVYTGRAPNWAKDFAQCVLDDVTVAKTQGDVSKLVRDCAIDHPDPKNLSEHGFDCTQECVRHEAGYKWAEAHSITDNDDCLGKQKPFEQGCMQYIQDGIDEYNQDRFEERPNSIE